MGSQVTGGLEIPDPCEKHIQSDSWRVPFFLHKDATDRSATWSQESTWGTPFEGGSPGDSGMFWD